MIIAARKGLEEEAGRFVEDDKEHSGDEKDANHDRRDYSRYLDRRRRCSRRTTSTSKEEHQYGRIKVGIVVEHGDGRVVLLRITKRAFKGNLVRIVRINVKRIALTHC